MEESNTKKLAHWYDALSQSYDELYGEEQSHKYDKVLQLLSDRKFRSVVDIGCGTGAFLQRAAANYLEAIGVDLSRKMLEKAKTRRKRNMELIMADASSLPIKDDVADCLVSISFTEANANLPHLLSELRRIAARPATLVITLFKQHKRLVPPQLFEAAHTTKLSQRENLYLIRLNSSPHQPFSQSSRVHFKNKTRPTIADTNARMLTPMARKRTNGKVHKMRQVEDRIQEGAARAQDDGERKLRANAGLGIVRPLSF